jgi:hypothetical protein
MHNFDPIRNEWIRENVGIAPDIEVSIDAKSYAEGRGMCSWKGEYRKL